MRLTGEEMAQASHGEWLNQMPKLITGIGTDSRDFIAGHAFLALRGVTFDGHAHAAQVADKASALIGDVLGVQQWQALSNTPQLVVNNTQLALGDIAAWHRSQLTQTAVVAITGSYGKTTVRSMLTHILQSRGLKVAATQANFNNLIGVPKTLFEVDSSADVAVIECGISEFGEMERLSEIVQPDVTIVTGISNAHGEGLGGLSGVVSEKAKLLNHLSADGWCVLGHGVNQLFKQQDIKVAQTTYDMDGQTSVAWNLDGLSLTLSLAAEAVTFNLTLPAKHWAEDMALAATVALRLAPQLKQSWTLSDVAKALETWQAVDGRMRVYKANANQNFTLLDDSYNANPVSMQAALDTLAAMPGYRLAIIGDMLELGDAADQSHADLDLHDIDEVVAVGSKMKLLQANNAVQPIRYFEHTDALISWLENQHDFPAAQSTVLLKSSHGMGLYRAADKLKAWGQHVI